jgi:chromosome segregation ATPase
VCKNFLILLLVSLLLLLSSPLAFGAEYLMTETDRAESLQIITELKLSLANRQTQYEALKQVNKQIEAQLAISAQKITDLEISLNSREISLQELRQEKKQIRIGLEGLRQKLEGCQRQNKALKITAVIEGIIIVVLAL